MSFKIPKYSDFLDNKDLLAKVPTSILEENREFFEGAGLNEGLGDKIKNSLSKNLLGGLSHINAIDNVLSKIYSEKKKIVDSRDKMERDVFELEKRLTALERSKSPDQYNSTREKIANLKNIFSKTEKVSEIEIERGEKLLSDLIKGNARKREYADAKESEHILSVAQHELNLAKKRMDVSPTEIKGLQSDAETAKKEMEEKMDGLNKSATKNADSKDTDKISKEKKKDIYDHIADTEKSIAEKKAEYERKKAALEKKDTSKMSEAKKKEYQRPIAKLAAEIKGEKAYLKELKKEISQNPDKDVLSKEAQKEIKDKVEKEIAKAKPAEKKEKAKASKSSEGPVFIPGL